MNKKNELQLVTTPERSEKHRRSILIQECSMYTSWMLIVLLQNIFEWSLGHVFSTKRNICATFGHGAFFHFSGLWSPAAAGAYGLSVEETLLHAWSDLPNNGGPSGPWTLAEIHFLSGLSRDFGYFTSTLRPNTFTFLCFIWNFGEVGLFSTSLLFTSSFRILGLSWTFEWSRVHKGWSRLVRYCDAQRLLASDGKMLRTGTHRVVGGMVPAEWGTTEALVWPTLCSLADRNWLMLMWKLKRKDEIMTYIDQLKFNTWGAWLNVGCHQVLYNHYLSKSCCVA